MKIRISHIVILLFGFGMISAQDDVRLKLDSTEFMIGDQTEITISYRGNTNPDEFKVFQETIDTMAQIEYLGKGPLIRSEEAGLILIEQKLRIAFFDTGVIWIPAVPVEISTPVGLDTLETNDIPVNVLPPQVDSLAMMPIKDIVREPWHIIDAWPYFLALLIAVLLYLSFRRRKRKKAESAIVEEPEIIKTPFEIAMEAIEEIPGFNPEDPTEVKEHFAILSIILRSYLEGQFGFPAAESTTYEIGNDMKKHEIPSEMIERISQLLREVDMVKFAKIQPSHDEIDTIRDRIRVRIVELEDWVGKDLEADSSDSVKDRSDRE